MPRTDTNQTPPAGRRRASRPARGSVLIYCLVLMTLLIGMVSLGMDYAHLQSVKTESQRSADMCARDFLQVYLKYGAAIATTPIYVSYIESSNGVDGKYAAPTYVVTPGTWDSHAQTFSPGSWAATVTAVQVTVTKSSATGNPVQLLFGRVLGRQFCDVHARATAALVGGQSGTVSVPATASLYLAGMPPGSTTAGWGDSTSNAAPYAVNCITVVPGTYVTVTSTSGTSSVLPGTVPVSGPGGNSSIAVHHGENYNHNPNPGYDNAENGIGDATMPEDALCGVFLNDNSPTAATAPTGRVDWSNAAQADKPLYDDILKQQPFMIGTGQTTGGTTKQFLVPAGATRLYLSIWDGVQYSNNTGTVNGTINVQQKIMLVDAG